MKTVFEQIHNLKYYGGWSLFEIFNIPVGLRNWFSTRLQKQLEDEKEALKNK